ncbi:MAG: hypothetical protein QW386_04005 [Candidatus Bathyarchaeia archaeon]
MGVVKVRLLPGQREVRKVLLRHFGVVLSFENVKALPSFVCVSDFHCVEEWNFLRS